MSKFLKDNFVLIVGVSLPVVVVLLFLLASEIPKRWVDPPRYSFLFVKDDYVYSNRLPFTANFDVYQERLRVRVYKVPNNQGGYLPKLYLYDHQQRAVRELAVNWPEDLEAFENGAEAQVPDAKDWRLDPSHKAPDGYEYRDGHRRGRGLFGEIFYSGRHARQAIVKNGAVYPIPSTDGRDYYYNLRFMGWVVGEAP